MGSSNRLDATIPRQGGHQKISQLETDRWIVSHLIDECILSATKNKIQDLPNDGNIFGEQTLSKGIFEKGTIMTWKAD